MNKRIYHDSKVSYLIIEPVTDIDASLSINMMKNNKIQGLLDMECRYADNKMDLYYEIQGMQCLEEYISEYGINYNLARQLYMDIAQAVLNGEEFFLSENSYVMDLEYIFWDKKNKRAKFCCMPGLQNNFQEDIKKLTEELMEYIGGNDRSTAEFIYGIYGLITDSGFVISDVKAYINGFKPGAACAINEKITDVNEEIAINNNITAMNKKYILCINKTSLPFKANEKGYINIYLEDIWIMEDENHLEASVGRDRDCGLILPSCFVSRHHAVFYVENENIYIEDVGSANGTFVNNEKIPANVKILCNVNDIISFAGIKCRLSGK